MSKVHGLALSNGPMHVLTREARLNLLDELSLALENPSIHTILLVGSPGAFSVGADLNELQQQTTRSRPEKELATNEYVMAYHTHNLASIVHALDSSSKPIAALITGNCFGGGLELALGAHYRFCTEDSKFRLPEVLVGIIPGALGTQLLPRLVPFDVCLRMCSGKCETLDAGKALKCGLVDQILSSSSSSSSSSPLDELISRVVAVLDKNIQRGENSATPFRRSSELQVKVSLCDAIKLSQDFLRYLPIPNKGGLAARGAVEALLACVQNTSFLHGARIESEISRRLVVSDEAQALRYLFFAERSLNFSPRPRPSSARKAIPEISINVGIVGAGLMGVGISVSVLCGEDCKVILCDVSEEVLCKAKLAVEKALESLKQKSRNFPEGFTSVAELLEAKFTTTTDYVGLKECDLVIECVFEDLNVKSTVFHSLEEICSPSTIFCSNTSSLDVELIAANTKRPGRVLGLHFFSPAHIMTLVEIVITLKVLPEVVDSVRKFVQKIHKVGVVVKNFPGFVGNRMIFVYFLESMACLEDGASVEAVDSALREFGFPMGPLEMADMSGLDVGYRIRQHHTGLLGKNTIADDLYNAGRLGQKNHRGFYNYAEGGGGKKILPTDPIVQEFINRSRSSSATSEIPNSSILLDRLLFSLINEGFKSLGEGGVLSFRPGDIDVIFTRGFGWPSFRGGPLFYADFVVGLPNLLSALNILSSKFPSRPWFQPAPLLMKMVEAGVTIFDVQRKPEIVRNLMEGSQSQQHLSKL